MNGLIGALIVAGLTVLIQGVLLAVRWGAVNKTLEFLNHELSKLAGRIENLEQAERKHDKLLVRIAERLGLENDPEAK